MACEEEQAAAVKRCRSTLHSRIKEMLEKVVGSGGKDRAKMAHKDSDPADTSKLPELPSLREIRADAREEDKAKALLLLLHPHGEQL